MSEKFFLGKSYDLQKSEMGEQLVRYDPDDLTTHAVITGMTGSGKTGLGMIMLEEAALQGIPAIVIDPKGDLTNLLLHFPDLLPEDYKPWVNQDAARREGVSVEVIDLRTLCPLDKEAILNSVKKTGRLVIAHEAVKIGGFGGEIASLVAEEAFDYLDAPIKRVGALFVPLSFSPVLEDYCLPSKEKIIDAVRETVG